ncbi:TPA: hypothetical protein DEP58_04590 [Patescibacteria group bacterium]|nr:MAG: hypothetical protein UU98_C0018G0046 [Parcubacteria group bacterium GW2011_GWD2_42_14]HCC05544.1 hypothetical protein [Patescibacteria group bacterium]
MNVAYTLGYVPQFEGWQYLYVFIIGWSALIMIAGLLFDMIRQDAVSHQRVQYHWLAYFTVGLGLFSIHPAGLIVLFSLNVLLQDFAPGGACVIATMLTVFGIWSFIYNMFGEEFWKTVRQKRRR